MGLWRHNEFLLHLALETNPNLGRVNNVPFLIRGVSLSPLSAKPRHTQMAAMTFWHGCERMKSLA